MKIEAKHRLLAEKYSDYIKKLNRKFRAVGSGWFGIVFEIPGNNEIVVKVSTDSGAREWLEFCTHHTSNPWLLRVSSIHKLDVVDRKGAFVAFIERLKHTNLAKIGEACDYILSTIPESLRDVVVPPYRPSESPFENMKGKHWAVIAANTTDANIEQLAQYFARTKHTLDMGIDNILVRGNQVVFADPILVKLKRL